MSTKHYNEKNGNSNTMEPRVAKLEVGLDRLTEDVRDLAGVVRNQGSAMEQEIQKLVVAVTQAAGPRKTEWSVIISSILLVMAIGSAVFWPLNQTTQETKEQLKLYYSSMVEHQKLDGHPVGLNSIQDTSGHVLKLEKSIEKIQELETIRLREENKKLLAENDALRCKSLGDKSQK